MSERANREKDKDPMIFTDILNRRFPWAQDEPAAAPAENHRAETAERAGSYAAESPAYAPQQDAAEAAPVDELAGMFGEDSEAFTEAGPDENGDAMKNFFNSDTDSDNGPALRSKGGKKKKLFAGIAEKKKTGEKRFNRKEAAENLQSMEKSGLHILGAFLMGLGNFTVIPVGRRTWHDSYKDMMLATLPAIGAIIGTLWVLFGVLLMHFTTPIILYAFLMVAFMYGITGFFHVDGFMDCCDAILSRRDLEERRRILKDPRVGSFAVIAIIFLVLGSDAAMESFLSGNPKAADLIPLIIIPVISRAVAGGCVLFFPALPTSQYAKPEMTGQTDLEALKKARRLKRGEFTAIVMQVIIFFEVLILIGTALGGKTNFLAVLTASLATMFTTLIVILGGRYNLQGMNGDIAGFGICLGELAGLIAISYI